MSVWKDIPEWTPDPDAPSEGWLSLIWILRGGLWDDDAEWVDTEEWDE